MWAYFIMPTYNSTTGGPMGMFKNSTKETKEFESIILDIEKERKKRKKDYISDWFRFIELTNKYLKQKLN